MGGGQPLLSSTMEGKQVGRAAAVLAHPGHEDIVEEILSHLDWKTVLVAAQVSYTPLLYSC